MNRNRFAALSGLIALLSTAETALAQYDLSWHTIDGGGAMFTTATGGWELSGSIGQPDAGVVMTGGGFEVTGGFWVAAIPAECPADLNGDGNVSLTDLSILLSHFGEPSGASPEDGDVDADGDVDLSDLAILLANFGLMCS